MAARENQGLQIALIVFVMLTIILGVTTFIFYRQYDDADIKAKTNLKEATENKALASAKQDENGHLKKLIGFAETDDPQAIDSKFSDDMKTFAGTFPEDTRVYREVVAQLSKTLQDKTAALTASQAEVQDWEDKYKVREAGAKEQINKFEQARDQANKDLTDARKTFNEDRERINGEKSELAARLQKSRKDSEDAVAKVEANLQKSETEVASAHRQFKRATEKLEAVTKETFETPSGEIRWVSQRDHVVWINLGRADALNRQTTFSVYTPDATDVTKSAKKASIEVTRIIGDHLAEARVLDDKFADPIVLGDVVYTPLWSPREQRHFALAGFMDVNGDGIDDQKLLHDVIVMNGGVVDCEADDKGEVKGQITVNTRYLVLGEEPKIAKSAKGDVPKAIAGYTTIREEADKYGVQKVNLGDLLQRMGWKNETPVIRYGRGANPNDFKAKADEVTKVSRGEVTELFQPRNPPPPKTSGAY